MCNILSPKINFSVPEQNLWATISASLMMLVKQYSSILSISWFSKTALKKWFVQSVGMLIISLFLKGKHSVVAWKAALEFLVHICEHLKEELKFPDTL